MSVRDIPRHKLKEVAKYLDGFPPSSHDNLDEDEGEEQYWGLFVRELKRIPNMSKKFSYTNVQIVEFGEEDLKGRSPSLKLLYDLQEKKLELESFVYCLQKINCREALNVFRDATTPIFTQQPEPSEMILKRDEHIILTVEAKCDPGSPKFQWFKGETPLVGEKSNKLVIYNAHRGNSGFYICRATNPFINDEQRASVFSQWVKVEVQEVGETQAQSPIRQETVLGRALSQYPLIVRQPSPLTVDVGHRAVLECSAEGAVVFDWYKDGKPFRKGARDGRLVFEKVRLEDGGEYQCAVVNDRAEVKSSIAKLTVESEIEIIRQPEDVSSHVGEKITLYCKARSTRYRDKKLVYQWFEERGDKDYELKVKSHDQEKFQAKLDFESYKVLRVHCVVSLPEDREVFVRSMTARITVSTVWITRQPQPIDGYIGQRARLICEAEGLGNITYLWLKSSTKDGRKELVKSGGGVTITGGILTFEWLHGQKHRGYYTCQAENDQNHIDSKTVLVSAEPRTGNEREVKPPVIHIMKQPRSQVVPQGGRFRLICKAVATEDEPLHYQWYHSGTKLTGEKQTELVRNKVVRGDYGSYYCEVKTHSEISCEVSKSARIELALTNSGPNLEKKSSEQLKQMEAERLLVTANDERYALEKVALLIGNQKYESHEINKLVSPENDIRELCKLLEAPPLNFKVISLVNLKYGEMMKALDEFYQMLTVPGVYALFYYSGHGFNYLGSSNYLVPVDATLPLVCENNIESNAIGLGMQNRLSRAVVVLDCCRISKDDIPPPLGSLTSLTGYANHIEISSCADNARAFESRVDPCSEFNIAFRKALAEKRNVHDTFTFVQDALRKAELSLNGDAHQRPSYKGSFADVKITLHDDVMMDDPKTEEQLDKICQRWQLAQTLPDPVLLSGRTLGEELAGLVAVQLSFSRDFSNVLLMAITVRPLQENCSCTTIDFDKGFLEAQGVHGELSQAHHPATLRITDVQRIKDTLKLVLKLRVTAGGVPKVGSITYKLKQKPLFACLLEQSSS